MKTIKIPEVGDILRVAGYPGTVTVDTVTRDGKQFTCTTMSGRRRWCHTISIIACEKNAGTDDTKQEAIDE